MSPPHPVRTWENGVEEEKDGGRGPTAPVASLRRPWLLLTPPPPPPSTHSPPTPSPAPHPSAHTHTAICPPLTLHPLSRPLRLQLPASFTYSPDQTSIRPFIHPSAHPATHPLVSSIQPTSYLFSHRLIHLSTHKSIYLSTTLRPVRYPPAIACSHPVLNKKGMASDVGVRSTPAGHVGSSLGAGDRRLDGARRPGRSRGDDSGGRR